MIFEAFHNSVKIILYKQLIKIILNKQLDSTTLLIGNKDGEVYKISTPSFNSAQKIYDGNDDLHAILSINESIYAIDIKEHLKVYLFSLL